MLWLMKFLSCGICKEKFNDVVMLQMHTATHHFESQPESNIISAFSDIHRLPKPNGSVFVRDVVLLRDSLAAALTKSLLLPERKVLLVSTRQCRHSNLTMGIGITLAKAHAEVDLVYNMNYWRPNTPIPGIRFELLCLKLHESTDIFEEFHCFICKLCGRKLSEIEIFRDSFILHLNTYTSRSERSQNSIDNQSEELDLSAFDNPEAGEW